MAVGHSVTLTGPEVNTGTSKTISVTHPGNADLLVMIHWRSASVAISSVTYNSVALTQLESSPDGGTGPAIKSAAYRLADPGAGTHNLVITWAAAILADAVYVFAVTGAKTQSAVTEPVIVGYGAYSVAPGTSPLTPTYPTGIQAGDTIYLVVGHRNNNAQFAATYTFPGDFASQSVGTASQDATRTFVRWAVATGNETGSISITTSGGTSAEVHRAVMFAVRGANTSTPFEAAGTGGDVNGTTVVHDVSVTSTNNSTLVLNCCTSSRQNTVTYFSGQTGGTWLLDSRSPTDVNEVVIFVEKASKPIAGQIDGGSFSVPNATTIAIVGFAIVPLPAAPLDPLDGHSSAASGTGTVAGSSHTRETTDSYTIFSAAHGRGTEDYSFTPDINMTEISDVNGPDNTIFVCADVEQETVAGTYTRGVTAGVGGRWSCVCVSYKTASVISTMKGGRGIFGGGTIFEGGVFGGRGRIKIDTPIPPPPVASRRQVPMDNTLKCPDGTLARACGGWLIAQTATLARTASAWDTARSLGYNSGRVACQTLSIGLSAQTQIVLCDFVVDTVRDRCMYMWLMNTVAPGAYLDTPENTQSVKDFWTLAAPRYKDMEWVAYELTNEPVRNSLPGHTGGPNWGHANAWIDSVTDAPLQSLLAIRDLYDHVRSLAPNTTILLFSTANLAPSSARWKRVVEVFESIGNGPVDWTKTLVSYHHYAGTMLFGPTAANSTDDGMDGIANFCQTYPVVMTEVNYWMEADKQTDQYRYILRKYERDAKAWCTLGRINQTYPTEISADLALVRWNGSSTGEPPPNQPPPPPLTGTDLAAPIALSITNPFWQLAACHRPIGRDTTYTASSHVANVDFRKATAITVHSGDGFGHNWCMATENDPLVTISSNGIAGGGNITFPHKIRIPVGFTGGTKVSGVPQEVTIWDQLTGVMHSYSQFYRVSNTTATASGAYIVDPTERDWGAPQMATSASGICPVGLVLRGTEAQSGTTAATDPDMVGLVSDDIPHALAIALGAKTTDDYMQMSRDIVPPAAYRDSTATTGSNNTGNIPIGALFGLPPESAGGPSIATLFPSGTFRTQQRRLARCIRNYGIYVIGGAVNASVRADSALDQVSGLRVAMNDALTAMIPYMRHILPANNDMSLTVAGSGDQMGPNRAYDATPVYAAPSSTLIFQSDWDTGWQTRIGSTPWFNSTPSFAGGSTGTTITQGTEKWLRISFVAGAGGSQNGMFFARHLPPTSLHIVIEYQFRLKAGFGFNHSGKLPGLSSWLTSTGVVPNGTNGYTCRPTWDSGGNLTPYIYHIDEYMWIPYGDVFPTVVISTGVIHTLKEELRMNTVVNGVAQFDGMARYWLDGQLVYERQNLRFSTDLSNTDRCTIARFTLDVFFGGGEPSQGPIQNDYVDLGPISVWSVP